MPKAAAQWAAFRSQKSDRPRAMRQFTDRTNFRQAYYKMVNQAFREDFVRAYVVDYYGKGGAGKSALLRRLEEELLEATPPPSDVAEQDCLEARERVYKGKKRVAVLRADFDDPALSSPASVLMRFREQVLAQLKNAAFPLFDLAVVRLSQKYGRRLPPDEEQALISDNPVISFALDVVGDLMGAGMVIKGVQTAAQLAQGLLPTLNGIKGVIRRCNMEISQMDAPELERRLPLYFAMDLNAMGPALVLVYLDTYEKMYSRGEGAGLSTGFREDWLTGPWGLVPNLGNAIFAVGGRNQLDWPGQLNQPEGDKVALYLDTHMVEGLEEEDSIRFLQSCAIENRELCAELHRISQGQPLYLDLCVDQYEALSPQEQAAATADLFGNTPEALVERHSRYIPDDLKDALYLLATMGRWSDSLCQQLSQEFPLLDPDSSGYEQLTHLSYVQKEGDCWSMDRTVAAILSAHRTSGLRQRLIRALNTLAEQATQSLSAETADIDPLDLVWQAVQNALPSTGESPVPEKERQALFRSRMKQALDALAAERSHIPTNGQLPADALNTLREMARRALEQKKLFFPEELEKTARQMEARAQALYQGGAGDLHQALNWQEEAVELWQSLGVSFAHQLLASQAALAQLRLEYLYVTGGLLTRDKTGASKFDAEDAEKGAELNLQTQREWQTLIDFCEAIIQRFPSEPADADKLPLARLWAQRARAEEVLERDAFESWGAAARLAEGRDEMLWYGALIYQSYQSMITRNIRLGPVEHQKNWELRRSWLEQAWTGLRPLAERDRRFLPKALLAADLLCQCLDSPPIGYPTDAKALETVEDWLRAQDSHLAGKESLDTLRDWRDWFQVSRMYFFLYSAPKSMEGDSAQRILWSVERLQEQINGLERILGREHPEVLLVRRIKAGSQAFLMRDPYDDPSRDGEMNQAPMESLPVSPGYRPDEAEAFLPECKELAELHQRVMGKWYLGTCEAMDILADVYEKTLHPEDAVPLRQTLWKYYDRLGEKKESRDQQDRLIDDLKLAGRWGAAIDLQKHRKRLAEREMDDQMARSKLVHLYLARLWQEEDPSNKKDILDALLELDREKHLVNKALESAIQWCREQGGNDPELSEREEQLSRILEQKDQPAYAGEEICEDM